MADTTLPSAADLRTNPALRQGLSPEQLKTAGLSPTEVQTIGAGFTGAFGNGVAALYRTAHNLTTDANGNVVPIPEPVTQVMANNAQNPQLPAGTTVSPVLQQVQPGEVQQNTGQLNPNSQNINTPTQVQPQNITAAQGGQAPQVDANSVTSGVTANTVNPVNTQAVAPMQAATMTTSSNSLVQNQLSSLFGQMQNGQVPAWAQGAYVTAQEQMAARGMGASSISAGATALAVMQSALPIAAADANTYYQADLNNFSAAQQTALTNFQARQQNMLTDTATANAAEQFNASSENQTQQFVSSMIGQISQSNAALTANMTQFNASQANSVAATNAGNALDASKANQSIQAQTDEFNSNLDSQREQFNSNMAYAINQSNVNWQRTVNTADTAAVNSANQTNAQNAFNMSQQDINNIWQQYLDESSWAFDASQTQNEMNYDTATLASNRQFITSFEEGQAIGGLATSVVGTAVNSAVQAAFNGGIKVTM